MQDNTIAGKNVEALAQPQINKSQTNGSSAISALAAQEKSFGQLRQLLGNDVVLLPIATGEKSPRFNGWNETTVDKMEDAEYCARFTGNIGVLLGKASGNLCSIDVDSDEDFAALLALNPQFRATLQTRGSRGGNIWLRLKGEYPDLAKLKRTDGTDWGEFRSTGGQTVIHGVHLRQLHRWFERLDYSLC